MAAKVTLTLAEPDLPMVGDVITLSCDVQPGDPALFSLSWYEEGSLVEGESSQTYQFSSVLEDDGKEYECRVNNGVEVTASLTLDLFSKFTWQKIPISLLLYVHLFIQAYHPSLKSPELATRLTPETRQS